MQEFHVDRHSVPQSTVVMLLHPLLQCFDKFVSAFASDLTNAKQRKQSIRSCQSFFKTAAQLGMFAYLLVHTKRQESAGSH
jgi:hypothetical protein